MASINGFANDLLIEFLEACHVVVRERLSKKHGESWLQEGVEKHLNKDSFKRTRNMLNNPMRVVDMGKQDDELYGVEHLWNIFKGNPDVFADVLENKKRTEVYCQEIAELRHNVSHRRQHHILPKDELIRFCQNAQALLRALESPAFERFNSLAESIGEGGAPWAQAVANNLPPAREVVQDFVGRREALRNLSEWLADDRAPQMVLWGYGGAGKSAIAYQFATEIADSGPEGLNAVIWLSAKKTEYISGEALDRHADFNSTESFVSGVMRGIYGVTEDSTQEALIAELDETPLLLIVDDLDSVLDAQDLSHLLLFQLSRSSSKILFTSRQRIHGLPTIEVTGFSKEELTQFVRVRASYYGMAPDECLKYGDSIGSVTSAFPLFIDDLLRYALLDGIKTALRDWSQKKGDAAREYALRRQLDRLGHASQQALMSVTVADRPVSSVEIATISGFADDDIQHALNDLLAWRLINRLTPEAHDHPTFSSNNNTKRLVQKTFGRDPAFAGCKAAFQSLASVSLPDRMRKTIAQAISEATALVVRGDFSGAEQRLRDDMIGELELNPDMWGTLGWVLSRSHDADATVVRSTFETANRLGARKEDTYYHWVTFEREHAEDMVGAVPDDQLVGLWQSARAVAEDGVRRCGDTRWLCQSVAYLCTREAKTEERLNRYTPARSLFTQAAVWARRSLNATAGERDVPVGQIYKTLALALEGSEGVQGLRETLGRWEQAVGVDDPYFDEERRRLTNKFPSLAAT